MFVCVCDHVLPRTICVCVFVNVRIPFKFPHSWASLSKLVSMCGVDLLAGRCCCFGGGGHHRFKAARAASPSWRKTMLNVQHNNILHTCMQCYTHMCTHTHTNTQKTRRCDSLRWVLGTRSNNGSTTVRRFLVWWLRRAYTHYTHKAHKDLRRRRRAHQPRDLPSDTPFI